MSNPRQLVQIRTKKLGLLILDARKSQRRSVEEAAQVLGITPEEYSRFENGSASPSLPQLELLTLFLNLPLEHFWDKTALSESASSQALAQNDKLAQLRNRMIGTHLRLARNSANFSHKELADRTGIAEERLRKFEAGELAVPLPELEGLCLALDMPIDRLFDQHGPTGRLRIQQDRVQKFLELPSDLQAFAGESVNRPYLELAMRLSEFSTEKLRSVAEALLEITY